MDGFAWHPLDLADRDSVQTFADWVLDRCDGRLDVLVNNAGIHLDLRSQWTEPQLVDGHEIHWRTNYLGTAHLTRLLLPALLERAAVTGDARVVHVVSKLHARGTNAALFDAIGAVQLLDGVRDLQAGPGARRGSSSYRRHEDDGLRAMSLHPGSVLHPDRRPRPGDQPGARRAAPLAAPLERRVLMTPEQGAQTTVHCADHGRLVTATSRELATPVADALDASVEAARGADLGWLAGRPWLDGRHDHHGRIATGPVTQIAWVTATSTPPRSSSPRLRRRQLDPDERHPLRAGTARCAASRPTSPSTSRSSTSATSSSR